MSKRKKRVGVSGNKGKAPEIVLRGEDFRRPAPVGRPTRYSDALAGEICARITQGEALVAICREQRMPGIQSVYNWLHKYPKFMERYAMAKMDQADTLVDETLVIADHEGVEPGQVARDRLRVDARRWYAGKVRPTKYGDLSKIRGGDQNITINQIKRVVIDSPADGVFREHAEQAKALIDVSTNSGTNNSTSADKPLRLPEKRTKGRVIDIENATPAPPENDRTGR